MEVGTPASPIQEEVHSNGFPRPPITPYDLSVLLTTIVFGVAKAATTTGGPTIAPTTLEWVGSVVVFLALYVLGCYKSLEPKSRWIEWFFNTTSQGFPHNLRKPTLDAVINEIAVSESKDTPIVTGNRMFVTISVVIFGVSKAIVTYRGLPTSANTLDWVFAIVVSSLTYCLEMYQDEAANAWPSAFQTDYQPSLSAGTSFLGKALMFSTGLIITSLWTIGAVLSLVFLWNWVPEQPPTKLLLPSSLEYIHSISCKFLAGCLATICLGISPFIMSAFTLFIDFGFMWTFLRLIGRTVLANGTSISHSRAAIAPAIAFLTVWGFAWRFFGFLGQAMAAVLPPVCFVPLFQNAVIALSESALALWIARLYKGITFLSGFGLIFTFILAIVPPISSIGLWIPTRALLDFNKMPLILRLFFTFGLISGGISSGGIFVWILHSIEQPNPS